MLLLPDRGQQTNSFLKKERNVSKMDRCKEEKTAGINKQVEGKKVRAGGKKCEEGQESVLMLTGPQATTEHTTCNNGGGLNHGGHPGRDYGEPIIIFRVI